MIYSVHPLAEQELAEAASFYRRSVNQGVAIRFLNEFDRVASLLAENPGFGTPFDLPRRMYPLRVFPYSVVYRPVDAGIRVLVVLHQHRAPLHRHTRN